MSKLTRKVVMLAKIESTYGTDPTPTAADDALLVNEGIEIRGSAKRIERTIIRDTFSPAGHIVGAIEQEITFEVEAKGGGWETDDPLPPEYDVLLRACGMSADNGTTGQLTYTPLTQDHESCTIYFYRDGILHSLVGCRGTWELRLPVDDLPVFRFTMRGLWADPSDSANPSSPTVLSLVPPRIVDLGLSIGSYSPVGVNSLQLAMNNTLVTKKCINATEGITGIEINARRPGGSLDPEVDTLANLNPWSAWKAATSAAIACTVGSVAGNRLDVSVPKAIYDEVGYGDRDGTLIYNLPFTCTENSSGDDELSLTFH